MPFLRLRPLSTTLPLSWVLTLPMVLLAVIMLVCIGHLSRQVEAAQVQQLLLLWLLILVGAAIVDLWLAQGLLNRLHLFVQVSDRLTAGNLAQRFPTNSCVREFNHLARSFNQMADQLQQSFQHLQTTLTESETKFTIIFRTSPDPLAIATWDEGRLLDVNDSLLEFFGYSRSEMVGRTAVELGLWVEMAQRDRYRTLLEQEGRVRNMEVQLFTKLGDIKTVLLSVEAQILDGQDCLIVTHRDITERHRAKAALVESQQQLALAQRVARAGYWEFDVATQALAWSEMNFHNWGLDPTGPPPRFSDLLKSLPAEDRDRLTRHIETAIAAGLPYQVDLRPTHPDGSLHYIDVRGNPVFDPQGQVVKLVGVSMDITDRKRAEQALQESEARFRQLAETVQEGFFVYDIGIQQYAYVNPAYWTVRGMSPDSAPAPSTAGWLASIHPDDRDRIEAALERERQGENFDQEYRYITPTGELRWLRSKAFPICNEAGQVVRVVGTVENITDRKRAEAERKCTEAALRRSEARFRSAFDDAPYGISLVAPTGQFVLVNAYYCKLLGYTEAELLHLRFQDITHPDDWDREQVEFERLLLGDLRTYQMEKRYLTKQGEVIPVVVNAATVYDHDGRPLYSVGHVQDIRDRLAINRMKDEFISVVSHELRTPITAIQGALVLLGAGVYADRPEKAQRMLEIAIGNSDRLVRLVDDILSFERLESGQVQLEKEPCQVAHLMDQAIDSVQPLADQATIAIAHTPLDNILVAAPDAIIQVLTNLLSNAIKFSNPGQTVWLTAEVDKDAVASSSTAVVFTVRDQGRGIPADKLDRIFDQFQQVDASDSRRRGGTGLGLAICKRIVEQHQGRIWVESQLGRGSTFFVALPLTHLDHREGHHG
ncbi:PAS domain S-box protein [Leptolyngbya sp. KIOST-1]|uniref:PAS domain S-box protein n=1 Tax=Leptolyngbya sp. KIOST-1 TaxID=1229172 RepID=UPI00055DB924|nr:PAS domain S-box protein [Leptolyngbya sp. KIOST-1]